MAIVSLILFRLLVQFLKLVLSCNVSFQGVNVSSIMWLMVKNLWKKLFLIEYLNDQKSILGLIKTNLSMHSA